jgi:hypothetical protein
VYHLHDGRFSYASHFRCASTALLIHFLLQKCGGRSTASNFPIAFRRGLWCGGLSPLPCPNAVITGQLLDEPNVQLTGSAGHRRSSACTSPVAPGWVPLES